MTDTSPLPIAVLISGGGTTLRNLLHCIQIGELNVQVRHVVSSRRDAGGLEIARQAEIPSSVVVRKDHEDADSFRDAIFGPCRTADVQLVVMGGFLNHVLIPDDFAQRVINIHPALIPSFCGKGYYGQRVHQAVLDQGVKITGCTVHFADDQYDHGPIILQQPVPVHDEDTAESLAARVFTAECQALPEAIRLLAAGRLQVVGRKVSVRNYGSVDIT